jgi:hypothetical protein
MLILPLVKIGIWFYQIQQKEITIQRDNPEQRDFERMMKCLNAWLFNQEGKQLNSEAKQTLLSQ